MSLEVWRLWGFRFVYMQLYRMIEKHVIGAPVAEMLKSTSICWNMTRHIHVPMHLSATTCGALLFFTSTTRKGPRHWHDRDRAWPVVRVRSCTSLITITEVRSGHGQWPMTGHDRGRDKFQAAERVVSASSDLSRTRPSTEVLPSR